VELQTVSPARSNQDDQLNQNLLACLSVMGEDGPNSISSHDVKRLRSRNHATTNSKANSWTNSSANFQGDAKANF
jgi:hypothetical protein